VKNKVALISGSTSGIGLSIAMGFAKSGYDIVFNGLELYGPEIAASIGKKYKVKTFFSAANLLHASEIASMLKEAHSKFGNIDVLINNAGIQHVSAIEDFPDEKWNQIVAINLTAAFHTCKGVWPQMREQKWGRIINIASVHGLVASECKSAYVASKHGLIGLTKALALEGAGLGITANAICPGFVKTSLINEQIDELAKTHTISKAAAIDKFILAKQPVKEFVSTESIAALSLFLASDQASMITGTALPIDGGWTTQ
jgi:3-hydroxybutyrate dehydrogenase